MFTTLLCRNSARASCIVSRRRTATTLTCRKARALVLLETAVVRKVCSISGHANRRRVSADGEPESRISAFD